MLRETLFSFVESLLEEVKAKVRSKGDNCVYALFGVDILKICYALGYFIIFCLFWKFTFLKFYMRLI